VQEPEPAEHAGRSARASATHPVLGGLTDGTTLFRRRRNSRRVRVRGRDRVSPGGGRVSAFKAGLKCVSVILRWGGSGLARADSPACSRLWPCTRYLGCILGSEKPDLAARRSESYRAAKRGRNRHAAARLVARLSLARLTLLMEEAQTATRHRVAIRTHPAKRTRSAVSPRALLPAVTSTPRHTLARATAGGSGGRRLAGELALQPNPARLHARLRGGKSRRRCRGGKPQSRRASIATWWRSPRWPASQRLFPGGPIRRQARIGAENFAAPTHPRSDQTLNAGTARSEVSSRKAWSHPARRDPAAREYAAPEHRGRSPCWSGARRAFSPPGRQHFPDHGAAECRRALPSELLTSVRYPRAERRCATEPGVEFGACRFFPTIPLTARPASSARLASLFGPRRVWFYTMGRA